MLTKKPRADDLSARGLLLSLQIYRIPIAEQVNIIRNRLTAENNVVHTTSWPASSPSCPICTAIGELDTATGVPQTEIITAISAAERMPTKYATTRHTAGIINSLVTEATVISFHRCPAAPKLN